MAAISIAAGGTAAIAAGLTALWAYANGDDVGESVKSLWEKTEDKIKNWASSGKNDMWVGIDEEGKNVYYGDARQKNNGIYESQANYEKRLSEENENENGSGVPPQKEENPYGKLPVSPQGAIAGAMTGINNSDNNTIQDTTNNNIEQNIGSMFDDYIAKMEEYQKKQWEREDTAYQRAVEDARKAGINVGALGGSIQPAASTTSIMSSASNTQFQEIAEFIQQEIDNNFSGNQNDKDRLTQALQMMLMMALMSGKK